MIDRTGINYGESRPASRAEAIRAQATRSRRASAESFETTRTRRLRENGNAALARRPGSPQPSSSLAGRGSCGGFAHSGDGGVVYGRDESRVSERDALSRRVEHVLATPGFQLGHWGILVVDRKTGQTIYERNADLFFAPASVTKLFSTAAALVELGPNFRFQTPLVRRGEVDVKGTLHGDVILVAQGDLAMGGRTGPEGSMVFQDNDHTYAGGNLSGQVVPTDPLAGLEHIAREVKAAGISEITGEVIVDDRLFAPSQSTGSGPRIVSPIVINDNVIDVFAQPARQGGRARSGQLPAGNTVRHDGCPGRDRCRRRLAPAGGPRGRPTAIYHSRPVAGGSRSCREDL